MSVSTFVASLARQFRFVLILGEKRAKTGWVGGWAANSATGSLALCVFQPNAGS